MTAAFDTDRRRLGLSIADVADLGGVQERTARGWCNGRFDAPDDVRDALGRVEAIMAEWIDHVVARAEDVTETGPVPLRRFRDQADLDASPDGLDLPVNAHAMMIAWAADALESRGIEADIIWHDG